MQIISDLHIHGRFSRATSKELTIKNLEKYARIKGLNLLGTGDFTHPKWIKELKNELTEDITGILRTKSDFSFLLQTEISLIYTQAGKGRKIHNIVLAPSFEVVEQINEALLKKGRLDYDGRPIFGMSCVEFVEMMKGISNDIEIIPSHIWTPWFSLFGSMSGFDSVEECFKEQTKHIHALETGLSSDPAMNWMVSFLDKYSLVSFSDSHSFWPWRIGRESTIFDLKKLTYKNIINALKTKQGLDMTIEFWPEEGKYHYDGHRNCNICMSPKESIKNRNICPVCGRNLTIGVAHRVEALADREEGYKPENAVPFKNLIPLSELISGVTKSAVATKRVWEDYYKLIKHFDNEMNILLNVPYEELRKVTSEDVADIIIKNREQKIRVKPGYDGVYGKPIFNNNDLKEEEIVKPKHKQTALGDFS
jgi:uncharacterized protein (TIGR00375 family)